MTIESSKPIYVDVRSMNVKQFKSVPGGGIFRTQHGIFLKLDSSAGHRNNAVFLSDPVIRTVTFELDEKIQYLGMIHLIEE